MSPKIELMRLINVQFKNHGDEKNSFTMFLIGMIFPMSAQIKGTVTDATIQ